MIKGYSSNEYGTRVSVHQCEFCGVEFTVCPVATSDDGEDKWRGCMAPDCESYDPNCDVDKSFDEDGMTNSLMMDSKLDEELWDVFGDD